MVPSADRDRIANATSVDGGTSRHFLECAIARASNAIARCSQDERVDMKRKCPHCGCLDVRKSGSLQSEAQAHRFHSPYRCRECDARFWVVSRKAYLVALAGVVIVVAALVVIVGSATSIGQATAALGSAVQSIRATSDVHSTRANTYEWRRGELVIASAPPVTSDAFLLRARTTRSVV